MSCLATFHGHESELFDWFVALLHAPIIKIRLKSESTNQKFVRSRTKFQ